MRTDSWSNETALSNWNVKARWASAVCVYTGVHTDIVLLNYLPLPHPLPLLPLLLPSSPSSDDVHPLRAALHAGRRLSAHVLCGGQRQVPPPPAARGAGSGCTVTNSMHQDIPSVPVECAVCFAHPVTHMCAHASLASIWLARPPQQVWLARPPQHTSLAC